MYVEEQFACLSFATLSSAGLFHRVILMSGSVFAPWSRVREPRSYAEQLAKKMNCTLNNNDKMNDKNKKKKADVDAIHECLRKVPADVLASTSLSAPSFHTDLGPSLDGVTVKDDFGDIQTKRKYGAR